LYRNLQDAFELRSQILVTAHDISTGNIALKFTTMSVQYITILESVSTKLVNPVTYIKGRP